ncbi:SRPBCC family protein [Tomitella fengzijianii]|uniref:SRPBCC family protein n=1 Tax=Tomitella fengzijianii TaxID=2597660 RepID=A0A516X5I3_9ACTN|nr:SRPBCC family protein [Tomitella fengzijianii]QDQ98332.1 SRPBCC family protein [Tomitella fengzijianii]
MSDDLKASIEIDAPVEKVWTIVSDLKRMGEWSPMTRKMRVSGPVGVGTKTFNLNKSGWRVWPTTSKVVRFESNKQIAFRVNENRTIWSYELISDGQTTTVTERREVPEGTSKVSQFLVKYFMGGTEPFEQNLAKGMDATLARIKREAEAA